MTSLPFSWNLTLLNLMRTPQVNQSSGIVSLLTSKEMNSLCFKASFILMQKNPQISTKYPETNEIHERNPGFSGFYEILRNRGQDRKSGGWICKWFVAEGFLFQIMKHLSFCVIQKLYEHNRHFSAVKLVSLQCCGTVNSSAEKDCRANVHC